MALTIYAKAGLLRSMTASRPRQQILALRPIRTNIAGRVETAYLMTVPQEVLPGDRLCQNVYAGQSAINKLR